MTPSCARPAAVPTLDPAEAPRLRETLLGAGFTVAGTRALLGPVADAALVREQRVPALRGTTGGSPLETLVRLFLLGVGVPASAAQAAFTGFGLDAALAGGLLTRDGAQVRAVVDVRPYGAADARGEHDWFVVSDTPPTDRVLATDHVLGVGGASSTLAQITVRDAVASALDLGTGSGVQVLHLASHAASITGTDLNPRALTLARLTCALSGVARPELAVGNLFEPVAGRSFDLVVSNPPFVVSPAGRHTYRDSGLSGDEVCRRIVAEVPAVLAPGGTAQLLANWVHRAGESWQERVGSWVEGTGCDAWIVQREVQDPAEYVEMWLRDSGDSLGADHHRRYDEWLSWFEAAGVTGIGFGYVTLRRTEGEPDVRISELHSAVAQPLGGYVSRRLGALDWLRDTPAPEFLASRPVLAPDVHLERLAVPLGTAAGWQDVSATLVQRDGARLHVGVDPILADVAVALDGTRALGEVLDAVAAAHGADPLDVLAVALSATRGWVADGLLLWEPSSVSGA